MSAVVTKMAKYMVGKKLVKFLPFLVLLLPILFVFLFASFVPIDKGGNPPATVPKGNMRVSEDVLRWQPTVEKYAMEFGVQEYVPLILALIQQESGGNAIDVMQAAEGAFNTKYPKVPNGITDPEYSIWCGVQEFKAAIQRAGVTSPSDLNRIKLALQQYNFGPGFHYYVMENGGDYTIELAKSFSLKMAQQLGWACSDWRAPYCYGDYTYPNKILRFYTVGTVVDGKGNSLANQKYDEIIKMASQYEGMPYVFGGRKPPYFDCSGLIEYVYAQFGIEISGTAAMQWDKTLRVENPAPGDLVFFKDTYKPGISHVGIYMGNNMMFNAGGDQLHFASLDKPYWKQHFAGFGRVQ